MCIGIGIAFCIVIVIGIVWGRVHMVGHASPPLVDAASWRRSSAFSSASRFSSAASTDAQRVPVLVERPPERVEGSFTISKKHFELDGAQISLEFLMGVRM